MQYSNSDKLLLKQNKCPVLSKITLINDGTVFTEDDYISDWEYKDFRYVPNNGFIGQFVEKTLDGKLKNIPDNRIFENQEINLKIGIVNTSDNDSTTWYDYGNFLITKVTKEDTTGNYKFQSADYTKKFNKVYESNSTYPTVALDLANDACTQADVVLNTNGYCDTYVVPENGLASGSYKFHIGSYYYKFTLNENLSFYDTISYISSTNKVILKKVRNNVVSRTEVSFTRSTSSGSNIELTTKHLPYVDFVNYDFVVKDNQYDSDATCRTVMKDVAKLGYTWVRVGVDNKVYLDFTPKATSSVDTYDQLSTDEYFVSKKSDLSFGTVNKVLIGMADIDGENMYETSQDYTPETECAIKIWDNNLTNTDTLRAIALNGCDRLFGITYMPMTIDTIGHPWLEGDELIKLTNVDNEVLYTYPFNRTIKYAGYIKGTISSETSTQQETKYEYKNDIISNVKKTSIEVDKANQTITALVSDVSDAQSNITTLQQTTDSLTATVEYLDNEYETNVVVRRNAEGNPIEVEDAGNYELEDFKIYGGTSQDGEPTPSNPVDIDTVTSKKTTVDYSGSSIDIDYSYDQGLVKVEESDKEFEGNTYQEQTSGKNILPNNGATKTQNGITFTKQEDGSVRVSGIASGDASYNVITRTDSSFPAGTYTLSGCPSGGSTSTFYMYISPSVSSTRYDTGSGATFSLQANETNIVQIMIKSGTNLSTAKTFYPMLESGTTKTSYEPYTYGASPNPNYPQPINVVTGNQEIEVCGKNLLENNNTTQTINGITFTKNDDGSIKLTNTSNAVTDYYLKGSSSEYVDLGLPEGSYNLSGCISGSLSTYMLYVVQNRNGSLSYLQSINSTGLNITIQNGDTFRVFIRVMSGQTPNTTIFPMLNEGSTPLPYEPYIGNKYEINLGKNLWNNYFERAEYNTSGVKIATSVWLVNGDKISVEPNVTYTISQTEHPIQYRIICFNGTTYLSQFDNSVNTTTGYPNYTFTTPNNCNGIFIQFRSTTENIAQGSYAMNIGDITNPQLEKGSVATSFSPYFTPIELCKINDYKDRIFKENDKWYIEKYIKKTNLPNLSVLNSGTVFGVACKFGVYTFGDQRYVGRNYYFYATNIHSANETFSEYGGYCNNYNFIVLVDSSTTLEDFNSKLSGTTVYYVLGVPTYTEITNEELISQLEALNTCELYSNITHYTTTSSNIPMISNFSISDLPYKVITISDEDDNSYAFKPLFRNLELCKIGDYIDYLYRKDGKWYKHSEIGKVVLDGSESWANLDANHRSYITYINLGIIPKAYSSDCLSNYFVNANTEQYIGFNLGASSLYLRIDNSFTNITQFKNWLSTYKPVFYFRLATPTETEITDEEIIPELNRLMLQPLYRGYNEIYLNDDVCDKLRIQYLTDSVLNSLYSTKSELEMTANGITASVETLDGAVQDITDEVNTIVQTDNTVKGNPVKIDDCGEFLIRNIAFYGNLEQNGIPTPTNFVPIQSVEEEHTLKIYCNNLLHLNNTHKSSNNVDYVINDNILTCNGTTPSSSVASFIIGGNTTFPAGTYTTSIYCEGTEGLMDVYISRPSYRDTTYGYILNCKPGDSTTKTFTITEDTVLTLHLAPKTNITYKDFTIKVQIEEGDKATKYSNLIVDDQHLVYDLGDLKLYKINDTYYDKLYYDLTDKKWYVYRRIGNKLLSDITPATETENDNYIVFRSSYNDHTLDATSDESLCFCKALQYKRITTGGSDALARGSGVYKYYYSGVQAVLVTIPKTIANSISGYDDWCNNNDIRLYYPLLEPTIEEVDDYDLIEQLNAILGQAKLYKTSMFVEDVANANSLVGDIEVTYLTDTIFNGVYASRAELNITQNSIESTVSETFTTSVQPVIESINTLGEQLQNTEANLQSNIDSVNNSLGNYALNSSLVTVTNTVQNIQTALNQQILVSKELQENGVTKVTTTTGFTFDENGLSVTKTGADTKTVVDEDGLTVYSATGSSDSVMLNADSQGVETENLHVRTYTQISSHSRLQDYEDGTAIFYIA